MTPLLNIRNLYISFLEKNQSPGVCMGLCLTWLGDILKDRPNEQSGGWLSNWFYSTAKQTPASKALLPSEAARLTQLFERAFRKHNNYIKRYQEQKDGGFSQLTYDEVTINHKNQLQLERERASGIPGLTYHSSKYNNFMFYRGLDTYNDKDILTGVIITFKLRLAPGGAYAGHAVAAFRVDEFETLFFDPNFGLFKTCTKYPMMEIISHLKRQYIEATPRTEIRVSRRLIKNANYSMA